MKSITFQTKNGEVISKAQTPADYIAYASDYAIKKAINLNYDTIVAVFPDGKIAADYTEILTRYREHRAFKQKQKNKI